MFAVKLLKHGDAVESVEYQTGVAEPATPETNQVGIRVKVRPINPADILYIEGKTSSGRKNLTRSL